LFHEGIHKKDDPRDMPNKASQKSSANNCGLGKLT